MTSGVKECNTISVHEKVSLCIWRVKQYEVVGYIAFIYIFMGCVRCLCFNVLKLPTHHQPPPPWEINGPGEGFHRSRGRRAHDEQSFSQKKIHQLNSSGYNTTRIMKMCNTWQYTEYLVKERINQGFLLVAQAHFESFNLETVSSSYRQRFYWNQTLIIICDALWQTNIIGSRDVMLKK